MFSPVEYMEAVLTELETLGMHTLVTEYLPPTVATSKLINDISKASWKAGITPQEAAKLIFKSFVDTKNKLIPHN